MHGPCLLPAWAILPERHRLSAGHRAGTDPSCPLFSGTTAAPQQWWGQQPPILPGTAPHHLIEPSSPLHCRSKISILDFFNPCTSLPPSLPDDLPSGYGFLSLPIHPPTPSGDTLCCTFHKRINP
eukprot:EG_transcript_43241